MLPDRTTNSRGNIRFVAGDRAPYPSMQAAISYLSKYYTCSAQSVSRHFQHEHADITYYMMGFQPFRPNKTFVVHHYSSLSVGRFRKTKDRVKRFLNAKPNLRIFQNPVIQSDLGFDDDVPAIYIPMGVPGWIGEVRKETPKKFDFVFVGSITSEKGLPRLFDSFLRHTPSCTTLLAIGPVEPRIRDGYGRRERIHFTGSLTQRECFLQAQAAHVAICYFPDHPPHDRQTPTKLLEYAALGLPIMCNSSRSNLQTMAEYQINAHVVSTADPFSSELPTFDAFPKNSTDIAENFHWERIFDTSGIIEYLPRRTT
jgi:glycosyltransferase involved in cell wall biosynthesis